MLDDVGEWAVSVWRRGMAPEPQLTVSQWADQHRVLPPASAEPGPWRTNRVPYLGGIMDALSVSSPFERVVFIKGAQVGGTEAGLNWVGYAIHHAPGTMLMVQPSLDAIKRNTTTRVDPLIEHSPVLRGLVVEQKGRETGNSMFRKAFPGGQLVMTSAGSGIGLRSIPARYLFLDEVDAYESDVDGEGDPVSLAIQRTVTFRGRRKIYLCSTPTLAGFSRIETAYLESDRRRFFVPCPACGRYAPLEWGQIRWPEGHRERAYRLCPEDDCGGIAEEKDKFAMLARGEWRPTAEGDGKTAGFHLSTLYSPFETWGEVAVEHGRVHKDPARLQTWVNNKLGQTWEDKSGETIEGDGLLARREDWGDLLPPGIVCLTAGIDVQPDRLEITVIGWGAGEQCWIVGHWMLWGDPSAPQIWADLDSLLARSWPHSLDVPDLPIRAACIDTGGANTLSVYGWARGKQARRFWAIKGRSTPGAALWPRRPNRSNKGRVPLYILNVDAGKDTLYARLKNGDPGPGFIHLHRDLTDLYVKGLTSERVVTKYSKGRPVREWVLPSGVRNEPLDCFVYSLAALHGLRSMAFDLDREAAILAGAPTKAARAPGSATTWKPAAPAPVIRSKWMSE